MKSLKNGYRPKKYAPGRRRTERARKEARGMTDKTETSKPGTIEGLDFEPAIVTLAELKKSRKLHR